VYLVIIGTACTGVALLLPRVTQQISEAVSQAPVYGTSLRAWEPALDPIVRAVEPAGRRATTS
jgi:hypothetical protein